MSGDLGIRHIETRDARLWVVESLEPAARTLGLLERIRFEQLFEAGRRRDASGRGATAVLQLPEPLAAQQPGALLVKRVRRGGALARLPGPLFASGTRAHRELRATALLTARGAPVPAPAFALAHRGPAGTWTAAVATVLRPDAESGIDFLERLGRRPDAARLLDVARAAGHSVRAFHDLGGQHADLHIGNLLVERQPTGVLIVDLDRARVDDPASPARRMHELARLYRSLEKRRLREVVGDRGIATFFGAYVAGDRSLRRALVAHWPREARRLRRHRLGYSSR